MKAVLMAAGRSTRTWPVTRDLPKPLLPILGTPIIGYTVGGLQQDVEEWHILISPGETQVKSYLLDAFPNLTFHFTEIVPEGTGAMIRAISEELRHEESFLVFNGDDMYHPEDVRRLINTPTATAVMGKEVKDPSRFGVFVMEGEHVKAIVEKPQEPISNLANPGVYKFSGEIFDHTLEKSPRGEYEIIDYINYVIAKGREVSLVKVEGYWLPITYPWDVLTAQRYFLSKADIAWRMDPTATVDGSAVLGKNVYIGKNCVIEADVELENVCVMERSHIGSFSRVHDSVLAPNTRIAPDTIVTPHEGVHDLPVAGKPPVAMTPSFAGIFTASGTKVSGFIDGPVFLE